MKLARKGDTEVVQSLNDKEMKMLKNNGPPQNKSK